MVASDVGDVDGMDAGGCTAAMPVAGEDCGATTSGGPGEIDAATPGELGAGPTCAAERATSAPTPNAVTATATPTTEALPMAITVRAATVKSPPRAPPACPRPAHNSP